MEKVGAYIHIPFCRHKCYYCDFCAFPYLEDWIDGYFENLKREIKMYGERMCLEIDSIYIGGGTPTYVDPFYIKEVVDLLYDTFKVDKDIEFTIEANPNSINEEKLKIYKDLGINRISLGVQSFDDEILKKIGRDHTKDRVLKDIDLIRKFDFDLSLDLILNLPGQDLEKIKTDLAYVKKISPDHLSWYSLIIEKGSRFYTWDKKGLLEKFDDDLERDIFMDLVDELRKEGLYRYEISNFAKKGQESFHNKKYWDGDGYVAFGLSGSGFLSNYRYNNIRNLSIYEKLLDEGKYPIESFEYIDKKEREKEYIIFKLRETRGINLKEFKKKFGHDLLKTYKDIIKKFYDLGYFTIGENLQFTAKGMDLSNEFYIEII